MGKSENPPKYRVAIHWTIVLKRYTDPRCLPIPMGNMPGTIYVPSTHLKHPVKSISPQGSGVLHAHPQSSRDQHGVHSPSISEPGVSHSRVLILTTSLHAGLRNLHHPVCRIPLSVLVFSPDRIDQTLHSRIQCIGAVRFHHSLILWIFRRTWKEPHRLITPVIEWMESRRCSDLKFESNSRIRRNSPALTIFLPVPMRLIKNPKTPWTVWEPAIAWWFRPRC